MSSKAPVRGNPKLVYMNDPASEPTQKDIPRLVTDRTMLEFVTFNGPSHIGQAGTSKKVRTQAMRDYIRKQKMQTGTSGIDNIQSIDLKEPSQYKGRFKLETWSHKSQKKARDSQQSFQKRLELEGRQLSLPYHSDHISSQIYSKQQPIQPFSLNEHKIDPFGSLSIKSTPSSEQLLWYYHNSYHMNSVAINPEGQFFSHARTDPAILHSILYLVALHRDLKVGVSDSPEALYHGGEAFKMISQRLQDGQFSDLTIAAVAMLVTKENLDGRLDLSGIHMRGLMFMVRARGGVQALQGVLRRVVTWSDFCHSNALGKRPELPRQTSCLEAKTSPLSVAVEYIMRPEDILGPTSPVVYIFHCLRSLSNDLDPRNIDAVDRLAASNTIYDAEFTLLGMNDEEDELTASAFSFAALTLRTAAYLFLYLVVRELPSSSPLFLLMVERLKSEIELQQEEWWKATYERKLWLLWVLFMGGAATREINQRWWFVHKMAGLFSVGQGSGLKPNLNELQNATYSETDPKEERSFVWRLDLTFLAVAFLAYAFKYLDQTNISNAYVSGMKEDLNLYGNQLNYFTTYFNIGYMVMLYPSCIIISHIGPQKWLPACEVLWGVFTCCLFTVTSARQVYGLRFLVGLFEGAAWPGYSTLIIQWYIPHEMAFRMSLFNIAQPVGAMLSGSMQGALSTHLENVLGRSGWRWAFIINGACTIFIALCAFVVLPGYPDRQNPLSKFYLKPRHIEIAAARSRRVGRQPQIGITPRSFLRIFTFWQLYAFSFAWSLGGNTTPSTYFNLWLKSLKNPEGEAKYTVAMLNYLPIIRQAVQLVAELLFSGLSDYFGSRLPFLLLHSAISMTSLVILVIRPTSQSLYMAGWYLNYVGGVSTMLLLAWASAHLEGEPEVRTVLFASGTILSYLQSAFVTLASYPASEAPHWRIGAKLYLGFAVVSLFMFIGVHFALRWEAKGVLKNKMNESEDIMNSGSRVEVVEASQFTKDGI